MGSWRYKWVSAVLAGEPDIHAIEKAEKRGWGKCPVYAVPRDFQPPAADPSGYENFVLYRMAEDKAQAIEEDRAAYNTWMARPETHVEKANQAIREYAGTLDGGEKALEQWSPIQGAGRTNEGYKLEQVPKSRYWRA